ncbi:hypothetical protein LL912_15415 [Niabella sp. CC-SYL272]|uniref:hypothetical protein n=1 Tax=Niabella agricola TaxID=2891571 RepID=UPI001F41B18D|nr:hypothetical protein [Niabella agricola]MCF3110171.1 hypothetical protein [Niabella agricola]
MQLLYLCPYWGQKQTSPESFLQKVIAAGYNGIEIDPGGLQDLHHWISVLKEVREQHKEFVVVAQMVLDAQVAAFDQFREVMIRRLELLISFNPLFINSHTGRDYFSFRENCALIQLATDFSRQYKIPVYHETHRGRFSYALHRMPEYLDQFPELELVADYSHWCAVSESMLSFQENTLEQLTSHIRHIHARVGYEQGPQLPDPFTPACQPYLDQFTAWWQRILDHHRRRKTSFTICTEAGPVPYMPVNPNNGQPLADQWAINIKMLEHLKSSLIS